MLVCGTCRGSLGPAKRADILMNDCGHVAFCSVECGEKAAKEATPVVPLHCLACGVTVSDWSSDREEPPLCYECLAEANKLGSWPQFVLKNVRAWAVTDPDIMLDMMKANEAGKEKP